MRRVVKATGDERSMRRFGQLFDLAEGANLRPVFDAAIAGVQSPRGKTPLRNPGAVFETILASSLRQHGVEVPSGTPEERAEVREAVAASLASVRAGP